jgi:UDP-N-acetylmuramoylalanine--D-glutamate ligase
MTNLRNKKITIIGAQKSGLALVRLITRCGGVPRVTDQRQASQFPAEWIKALKTHNVESEFAGHSASFIGASDMIVLSPGVRFDAPFLQEARTRGIPIWGEIEFAYQFCSKPVIAVTGSNGKTTVAHLITAVLGEAGLRPCLCGNVGRPFSEYVLDLKAHDYVVLEVSSFQLESVMEASTRPSWARGFRPFIAVLLNVYENHLDRHKNMTEYFNAKKRMFLNQSQEDYAVLNAQDPRQKGLGQALSARPVFFNHTGEEETREKNPNRRAALAVAKILDIPEALCLRVFDRFPGVEHRLEKVRTLNGITFINDSKSTTAEALRWALRNLSGPLHLVCGGKDKNIDFSVLKQIVAQKVARIYAIGEAKKKIQTTFKDIVPVQICPTLESAVVAAREQAHPGDTILLSPMCASFDMYTNFEERGAVFKSFVNSLT